MASPALRSRLRNFVFTINNYTDLDIKTCDDFDCKYMVYGKEVAPSTGTPHLQGYCELPDKMSFSVLRGRLPQGTHIEKRKGSAQQARRYCMKDGTFFERGTISKQGQRTDMEEMYTMVKAGQSDFYIQEALPGAYARGYKALDRMRANWRRQERKFAPMEVLIYVGPPGTGKTRKALEDDPDLFFLPLGKTLWWDGYCDQKTILMDDFYGDVSYKKMLRLLDGYKFDLPIKGGFVRKRYSRVVITSNTMPSTWWPMQDMKAFTRRVTSIIEFTESSESEESS